MFRMRLFLFFSFIVLVVKAELATPSSLSINTAKSIQVEDGAKFFFMTSFAGDIKTVKYFKLSIYVNEKLVFDLLVPNDYLNANALAEVVSFYSTRNLVYIGVGDIKSDTKFKASIQFHYLNGDFSKPAVYKN